MSSRGSLASESVQSAALALQGIDYIHSRDSFPLGVLSVGDSITDDIFQENLEDTTGLFVDQARDTLDTTSASQTAEGRFETCLFWKKLLHCNIIILNDNNFSTY